MLTHRGRAGKGARSVLCHEVNFFFIFIDDQLENLHDPWMIQLSQKSDLALG
jgi:hypothetical protein